MSKIDNASTFAQGFGAYYIMSCGLAFYPAIVMIQQFGSLDSDLFGGLMRGFLAGGVTALVIYLLFLGYQRTEKFGYLILLIGIYLFFLHPFIQYVKWMWGPTFYNDINGFPGFDWLPF